MTDLELALTALAVLLALATVTFAVLWIDQKVRDRRMRRDRRSSQADTEEFDVLADLFGDLQETSSEQFHDRMDNPAHRNNQT